MKKDQILAASSLEQLKTLGSFREIKAFLETNIDNKLGIRGWNSLYKKINNLKETTHLKKNILTKVCTNESLEKSKKEASDILEIIITARSRHDLTRKINLIIDFFRLDFFDPYKYYEKTKLKKFKDSSKLEGIDIEFPGKNTSLEDILSKYRR